MILSLILTVYNKAPFLQRAIKDLLNQESVSVNDYEIIIVNDGSTDDSLAVINDFVTHFPHVRVLNQENQGLSMARNNGLDIAIGDYVWFIDADDTISLSAVSFILTAAASKADIIPIYAKTEGENQVRNAVNPESKNGIDLLLNNKWEQCGVFYVYKKSFLDKYGLRFFPGIYHEDAEFTPRMLYYAETIKVVPRVLYTVFRDPNSITQIPRAKRAYDYLIVAERLSKFVKDNGEDSTIVGKAIAKNVAQDINNAFFIICKNSVEEQRKFDDKFYQSRLLLLYMLSTAQKLKYGIEALLFRLFPHHYIDIYKFMQFFNKQ